MLWVSAAAAALAAAGYVYLVRERLGMVGAGLAALRAAAILILLALLANAAVRRSGRSAPATVALDASLSMQLLSGPWTRALDTAVALAGRDGHVVRFGDGASPFDSTAPQDGRSRVGDALRLAAARGGPAIVVTDGELEDLTTLPRELRERLRIVLLPRGAAPGLAVTEAAVPERVLAGDSIPVTVELTTWGPLADSTGTLTIRWTGRTLLQRTIPLPPSPGRGRRTVTLPAGVLGSGVHALEIEVRAAGDPERRDDTRRRIVAVSALPAAVLVARPLDWEARFLARELADLVPGGVEAFGDLGAGRWVDLRTQSRVGRARVEAAIGGAALVLTRGPVPGTERARRVWRWPGGGSRALPGDWYVAADLPASPLVPRLAGLAWDSLPPVRGVEPHEMTGWQAVLNARLGRRGAQRMVLAVRDSGGRRELVTTATGLWRWAFRGGHAREAYRTLLAAGVEWLAAGDRSGTVPVLPLAPGVYRWRLRGPVAAEGVVAVEEYSPEFVPRARVPSDARPLALRAARVGLRELWWGFGIAMLIFLTEWAWRLRRGLP